jgi:hypothetical protein
MISLAECRKILGDAGRDMTDAQLEHLRRELYGLADITVTCFLAGRSRKATVPEKESTG